MRKIRVGIIGLGFGLHVHVPAFKSHSDIEVVALCGRDQDKVRLAANSQNIPYNFTRWEELLESDLDAISIATPPKIQEEIALSALSRKKALFCEKPLASSLQIARALASAAAPCPNMVDFQFMEITAWKRAKSLIESGLIGRVRHVSVNWHVETYANKTGKHSWKSSVEEGGGSLNSFASHTLYYLEQLIGKIRGLSARLFRELSDVRTGDTSSILSLEFETGGIASVSICTNAVLGSGHRIEIYGSDGALLLANIEKDYALGFRLFHGNNSMERMSEIIIPESNDGSDGRIAPVKALIGRFAEWILHSKPTKPNFDDGLRVQVLMDAALQAHRTANWVQVSTE